MFKSILLSIFIIVLFQSCVVYNKPSVSLHESVGQGKVKLMSTSGTKLKFTNIEKVDSVYYGIGREYISETNYITKAGSKMPLDSTLVSEIFVKNVKKSNTRTVLVAIFALPVGFVFTGVVVNLFGIW